MYGKGNVSNADVNHHKQMAMGKTDAGSVAKIPGAKQNHPTSTQSAALADGGRGIPAHGSDYGQQRAPDHGSTGKDHHRRGGLL